MDNETPKVSPHLYRVFKLLRDNPNEWWTSSEVAMSANVRPRTARAHLLTLTSLGVLDVAQVFPSHKYRWTESAEKRNLPFVNRIEAFGHVFKAGRGQARRKTQTGASPGGSAPWRSRDDEGRNRVMKPRKQP